MSVGPKLQKYSVGAALQVSTPSSVLKANSVYSMKQRHFAPAEFPARSGMKNKSSLRLALTSIVIAVASVQALAQSSDFGPGFGASYAHRSENDRAVRAGVVDLIERKKAGLYQAPIYNVTNSTNIAGDQINCDIAATTIGNTGSSSNQGESGAPSVLNSPQVTSASTGNIAGGEAGGPLNAGGSVGSNAINTQQGVDGSSQTSSVGSSEQGGVTGDVGDSTSNLSQDAHNTQTVDGSPLNSSIAGSSACSWQ